MAHVGGNTWGNHGERNSKLTTFTIFLRFVASRLQNRYSLRDTRDGGARTGIPLNEPALLLKVRLEAIQSLGGLAFGVLVGVHKLVVVDKV